jgi:energy-converting hydrogenase Eha subunit H
MKQWLLFQFQHFNFLMLAVIFVFQVMMAKANTQKLLKEQSQELYNELEEIKDEIRGNSKK